MVRIINVTPNNREVIQSMMDETKICKSYDLDGPLGRELHDHRMEIARRTGNLDNIRLEQQRSRIVPYII
jgi:hypothetical protein